MMKKFILSFTFCLSALYLAFQHTRLKQRKSLYSRNIPFRLFVLRRAEAAEQALCCWAGTIRR